ncbi:MAG: hypothetical protein NZ899_03770 [Thermoguttaceae bacterium]|nr:hypothetical protein [Thermoguttaceae bacterium]MDW8077749.1 hypothetical protein [Thermoguttaceae bacterium]
MGGGLAGGEDAPRSWAGLGLIANSYAAGQRSHAFVLVTSFGDKTATPMEDPMRVLAGQLPADLRPASPGAPCE